MNCVFRTVAMQILESSILWFLQGKETDNEKDGLGRSFGGFFNPAGVISHAASDLKAVKMVIPRGSTFVLSYYAARDAWDFPKARH
jgi:hypothetical protein